MSHCVTAIIARSPVIESILQGRDLVAVDLRDGLQLVPLDDADLDSPGLDFSQTGDGLTYLFPALAQFLSSNSMHGPLLYLETEYFGGEGNQAFQLEVRSLGCYVASYENDGAIGSGWQDCACHSSLTTQHAAPHRAVSVRLVR